MHRQIGIGAGSIGEDVDAAGLARLRVLGPDLPEQVGFLRDGFREALHGGAHLGAPRALEGVVDLEEDGRRGIRTSAEETVNHCLH